MLWTGLLTARLSAAEPATITETTPSRAEFFTWINDTWEGSNEAQSSVNLQFFQWLHRQYGMTLDLYAFDAGNIDTQMYLGSYGSMTSPGFQQKYPHGFAPLESAASVFGGRLGMWMGPDGYGTTQAEADARTETLVSLARDFNFGLFKIDAEGGNLAPGHDALLANALTTARSYVPDLILLDHRADLGVANNLATTTLWQGQETYIDCKISNDRTGTHHRVGAMARGMTPNLTRLLEDHGVCISSALDHWDDDLILQAFGRSLILAPEIYGNPWLLNDTEFPALARIFNLHRRYNDILVNGLTLPTEQYGPSAVARGDNRTRFVVLRNLTWNPVTYNVGVGQAIGLDGTGTFEVRQFHPTERVLGSFAAGTVVPVTVEPFRACLVMVSNQPIDEVGLAGSDYRVVQDAPGQPVQLQVLGMPGSTATIALRPGNHTFTAATLGGQAANGLLAGGTASVTFPGAAPGQPWHRFLGAMPAVSVPSDAEALYEATVFSASNNVLEAQALQRSGPTQVPQVQAARDAFFQNELFIHWGVWDRQAFDDNLDTYFSTSRGRTTQGGAFRIDLGSVTTIDELHFYKESDGLSSLVLEVSSDLRQWTTLPLQRSGPDLVLSAPAGTSFRYVRTREPIYSVAEIRAFRNGQALDRANWRASNLFAPYAADPAAHAWTLSFTLPAVVVKNSYFCVALDGTHGVEGAFAAARIGGQLVGAPDRAVAYPAGAWESPPNQDDKNYTYYIPVQPADAGKTVDLVLLGMQSGVTTFQPNAWITAPAPYAVVELVLSSGNTSALTAPSDLVVSGIGNNQMSLSWHDNAQNETGYEIESADGAVGNFSRLTSVPANTTSYDHFAAFQPGHTYIYRVRAVSDAGASEYSNQSGATPGAGTASYLLTVMNGRGDGRYTANATVTITADAATSTMQFAQWAGNPSIVTNPFAPTSQLTMPAAAATVAAAYVNQGVQTFADFQAQYFTAAQLNDPTVSGPWSDPDGDGWPNLLEYFMGTDPARAASVATEGPRLDGQGQLVMTFRMTKNIVGVSYSIEQSSDLATWTNEGVTVAVVSDQGSYYLMQATVPAGGVSRLFLRLSVLPTP